jgi:hypothetical protein
MIQFVGTVEVGSGVTGIDQGEKLLVSARSKEIIPFSLMTH